MKIRLISHASVILETSDAGILCDPWFSGKVFNESWSLWPAAAWDAKLLDAVSHLWISHEHPDHFHIPTLKDLPSSFKQRCVMLFQENNSEKMWSAFRRLGYQNLVRLRHRSWTNISPSTSVYCYQEGQMNSALAVREGSRVVLNINDAELRSADCRLIRRDVGAPDVVLNQYSIAGYGGFVPFEERLRTAAARILDNVVSNHRELGAGVTIPFASLMYFSSRDNAYINAFANTPASVAERFEKEGLGLGVLFPGDVWAIGESVDTSGALERYRDALHRISGLPLDDAQIKPEADILVAFRALFDHLHASYPAVLFRALQPFAVWVGDLGHGLRFCLRTGHVERFFDDHDSDLEVLSQPLWFCFKFPYGVQTLGVSGRMRLRRGFRNWQAHRILFAMNNAEVYLRPHLLLTARNVEFARTRLRGGLRQIVRRVAEMSE